MELKYNAPPGKFRLLLIKYPNAFANKGDPIILDKVRSASAAPCNAPTSLFFTYHGMLMKYSWNFGVHTWSVRKPKIMGMADAPAERKGIPAKIPTARFVEAERAEWAIEATLKKYSPRYIMEIKWTIRALKIAVLTPNIGLDFAKKRKTWGDGKF